MLETKLGNADPKTVRPKKWWANTHDTQQSNELSQTFVRQKCFQNKQWQTSWKNLRRRLHRLH